VRRELLDLRWRHPACDELRARLFERLAAHERLGLREEVREQDRVVLAERIVRLDRRDEVARHQPRALVDELIEGVLAVGAGLAPDDRARRVVRDRLAAARHALAVRLHVALLEVCREAAQVLVIRQDRVRLGAEEVRIPDAEHREDRRHVPLERRGAEVLVHLERPGEQLLERVHPDGARDRQPDRAPQRVAPADPVPERKHVLRIDAELRDLLLIGRQRDEVPRDRRVVEPGCATSHARAECAFVSVSCVVNVFDATMNSVVSGSTARSVSAMCVPSTFETKCMSRSRWPYGFRASVTMTGPRSEPPIPMFTTW